MPRLREPEPLNHASHLYETGERCAGEGSPGRHGSRAGGRGGGGGLGVPFRGRPVGAGGGLGVPFRRGRPGAAVGAAGAAAGYAAARSVISFSRCTIKASMSSFFVRQQKGK